MKSRSAIEVVRARPALGTVVVLRGTGRSRAHVNRAIESAFARIEHVQRLMSFHDASSELSRLNALPVNRVMRLSDDTCAVLALARRVFEASDGLFDPAIAPRLIEWGYLPRHRATRTSAGSIADVELLSGGRVRRTAAVQLDLGGIAKGYAVDLAVEALVTGGVEDGVVNAGGDLRVFGARPHAVHVRHPQQPSTVLPLVELCDASLATSGTYFTRRRIGTRVVSALVNPADGEPCRARNSVSVIAPHAAIADALTKVVLLGGRAAIPVLQRFSASAACVTAAGVVRPLETRDAA